MEGGDTLSPISEDPNIYEVDLGSDDEVDYLPLPEIDGGEPKKSGEVVAKKPFVSIFGEPAPYHLGQKTYLAGRDINVRITDVEHTPAKIINPYLYTIELTHGEYKWEVKRRYKHFSQLHNKLVLFRAQLQLPIPTPSKKILQEELVPLRSRRHKERRKSMATEKIQDRPMFPRKPEGMIREEHRPLRKQQLEKYLEHILKSQLYRNHIETMIFLEVSPLSFVNGLGMKRKEGEVKKRSGGRKISLGCCARNMFSHYNKRWFVIKDSFIAYSNPKLGTINDVLLFDKEFNVKAGLLETGIRHGLIVSNLSRTLAMKCWTTRKARAWEDAIQESFEKSDFQHENRYDSYAPVREDTQANWFVDGASYMDAVGDAMDKANEEIFITDWWLSPEIYLKRPLTGSKWRLDVLLKRKAEEGVKIYILLFKEMPIALGINSFYTKSALAKQHENIKVMRHPDGVNFWSHHEKLVIIDQKIAFLGGIDLCYGRWDTTRHRLADLGRYEPIKPGNVLDSQDPGAIKSDQEACLRNLGGDGVPEELAKLRKLSRMNSVDIDKFNLERNRNVGDRAEPIQEETVEDKPLLNKLLKQVLVDMGPDEEASLKDGAREGAASTPKGAADNFAYEGGADDFGESSTSSGKANKGFEVDHQLVDIVIHNQDSQTESKTKGALTKQISDSSVYEIHRHKSRNKARGEMKKQTSFDNENINMSNNTTVPSEGKTEDDNTDDLATENSIDKSGVDNSEDIRPTKIGLEIQNSSTEPPDGASVPKRDKSSLAMNRGFLLLSNLVKQTSGLNTNSNNNIKDENDNKGDKESEDGSDDNEEGANVDENQQKSVKFEAEALSHDIDNVEIKGQKNNQKLEKPITMDQVFLASTSSQVSDETDASHPEKEPKTTKKFPRAMQRLLHKHRSTDGLTLQIDPEKKEEERRREEAIKKLRKAFNRRPSRSMEPDQKQMAEFVLEAMKGTKPNTPKPTTPKTKRRMAFARFQNSRSLSVDADTKKMGPQVELQTYVPLVQRRNFESELEKEDDLTRLWVGKDYTNFIHKDFVELENPFTDFINRKETPRMPWHDIGAVVYGKAARDVARHFIQRWNFTKIQKRKTNINCPLLLPKTYSGIALPPAVIVQSFRCSVQMLRSSSAWSAGISETESSIHTAYLNLIKNSKHYIYIENQFFISIMGHSVVKNGIAEALYERITRAHKYDKVFRVYVIMPLLPAFEGEIGTPSGTSMQAITDWNYSSICRGDKSLLKKLQKEVGDTTKYITFYGLRTHEKLENKMHSELVYVHSKMMIVDDEKVIIGSANINDRSLLGDRDSEIAVLVEDTQKCKTIMNGEICEGGYFTTSLRKQLFREHLGITLKDTSIDIADPVCDSFYKDIWIKQASINTSTYDKVFKCIPSDQCKTFQQVKDYQLAPGLVDEDPAKAEIELEKIKGHLVFMPLYFLEGENLTPSVGAKERYVPVTIWT